MASLWMVINIILQLICPPIQQSMRDALHIPRSDEAGASSNVNMPSRRSPQKQVAAAKQLSHVDVAYAPPNVGLK